MSSKAHHPTSRSSRRPAKLSALLAAAFGALALAVSAPAAMADTACQDRSTSSSFSFTGDWNQYFAAPNGSFDSNSEWFHYGSRIVDGVGSPVNVARGVYTRSAFLSGTNTMNSTWTCVRGNEDTVRFLVKPNGSNPGNLTLRLYVSDPTSATGWSIKQISINPSSAGTPVGNGWYVTPRITIPWTPYWDSIQWISFSFNTQDSSGWYVDDVMIDPWRSN